MKTLSISLLILTSCITALRADIDTFGALDDNDVCDDFDGRKICSYAIDYNDAQRVRTTVAFLFEKTMETRPFYNDDRLERQEALEKALAFTYKAKQIDSNSNLALSEVTALYNAIHDRVIALMIMYLKSSDPKIRRSAIEYFNSMRSLTENYSYPYLFYVLNENAVQSAFVDEANTEIDAARTKTPNAPRL